MANTPLISIIVPVYNVERYLPRCIESILKQTYTNFELILVDDGTPDRSGIICDRYAEKDSRIKVIHKSNGGVSTARNAGIDAANGEWITFVDSDDWVSANYLMMLLKSAESEGSDLSVGVLERRHFNITARSHKRVIDTQVLNDINILLLFDDLIFLGPWVKLFSREIINRQNIRFRSGIAIGEDAIFVVEYMTHCKRISMSDQPIYHYNDLNATSVTHTPKYYPNRKEWDILYLSNYAKMLETFDVSKVLQDRILPRKVLGAFKMNAKYAIKYFDEGNAKAIISELLDYYDKWFYTDISWSEYSENKSYKELSKLVLYKDVDAIYSSLKTKNANKIYMRVRKKMKKFICAFIEKHRDGLIKFKF